MADQLDRVFKALADPTRRQILDLLRDGPLRTTELVEKFPSLSRFGVMKHMGILKQSRLVITKRKGRECFNSLNAVPIRQIYERWVSKYQENWAHQLLRIKESSEARD